MSLRRGDGLSPQKGNRSVVSKNYSFRCRQGVDGRFGHAMLGWLVCSSAFRVARALMRGMGLSLLAANRVRPFTFFAQNSTDEYSNLSVRRKVRRRDEPEELTVRSRGERESSGYVETGRAECFRGPRMTRGTTRYSSREAQFQFQASGVSLQNEYNYTK